MHIGIIFIFSFMNIVIIHFTNNEFSLERKQNKIDDSKITCLKTKKKSKIIHSGITNKSLHYLILI